MRTIRQAKGSRDCLACVAAMATQTTVKKYKAYCKKYDLPSEYDIALINYLWDNGYMVGFFSQDSDIWRVDRNLHVAMFDVVPAFVTVESDCEQVRTQGASHAVYWDGKTLHDPAGKRPWKKYKVEGVLSIVKNESHERWKK